MSLVLCPFPTHHFSGMQKESAGHRVGFSPPALLVLPQSFATARLQTSTDLWRDDSEVFVEVSGRSSFRSAGLWASHLFKFSFIIVYMKYSETLVLRLSICYQRNHVIDLLLPQMSLDCLIFHYGRGIILMASLKVFISLTVYTLKLVGVWAVMWHPPAWSPAEWSLFV